MKKILIALILLIGVQCIAIPSGLRNIGNNCFINASLQCLNNLKKFNGLLLVQEDNYFNKASFSALYRDFLLNFNTSKNEPFTAGELSIKGWQALNSPLGSQCDAAEFIDTLFAHIQDFDINPAIRSTLTKHEGTTSYKTSFMDQVTSTIETVITPVSILCLPSHKIEPFTMIHLEIIDKYKSLNDCLFANFAPSLLQGANRFSLGKQLYCDAFKTFKITQLPNYLIIDLKRKDFKLEKSDFPLVSSLGYTKKMNPIIFPLENMRTPQSNDTYCLNSFIVHSGSWSGGHYTAYVKCEGQWYYCNDSTVTAVSNEDIHIIADRGYGFDPSFITNISDYENLTSSKEQTPVVFFYEKK